MNIRVWGWGVSGHCWIHRAVAGNQLGWKNVPNFMIWNHQRKKGCLESIMFCLGVLTHHPDTKFRFCETFPLDGHKILVFELVQ